MRIDTLQQFVQLRRGLTQERDQISKRLTQINEALGELSVISPVAPSETTANGHGTMAPAGFTTGERRGGRRSGAGTSLRDHVLGVLGPGSAMTSREVLAAVQKRGYSFSTSNPLNSLGVILYGKNPKFHRADGKFSIGPVSGSSAAKTAGGERSGGGRRRVSPAARARMAEAQRRRWATSRSAGDAATTSSTSENGSRGSRRGNISVSGRKAIAAAARKRWAAAKASGKNSL